MRLDEVRNLKIIARAYDNDGWEFTYTPRGHNDDEDYSWPENICVSCPRCCTLVDSFDVDDEWLDELIKDESIPLDGWEKVEF